MGYTYKYFKIKKKTLSYLLPASRGSNVMTFTPSLVEMFSNNSWANSLI